MYGLEFEPWVLYYARQSNKSYFDLSTLTPQYVYNELDDLGYNYASIPSKYGSDTDSDAED